MTAVGSSTSAPITPTPAAPADDATTPEPAPTSPIDDASSKRGSFLGEMWEGLSLSGLVVRDGASLLGVDVSGENPGFRPTNAITAGTVYLGATGLMTARSASALNMNRGQIAGEFAAQAGTNMMRVTPTLVAAIAGPAIADGVTYIAPNLIPKYKKEMKEEEKSKVKIGRAIAGGVAVGLSAAIAFLVKPDLFKKVGFISEAARSGQILGADGAIIRQLTPMARDAVFSNRMLLGLAGGGAALLLANHAMGQDDDGKRNLFLGLAGGAAALTAVGLIAMPKLTRGAAGASKLAFMPSNDSALAFFQKPNKQWVKDFASKVAPVTAVPAATAASQYFNITTDFETITKPNGPWTK